jgi:hypothetical protein
MALVPGSWSVRDTRISKVGEEAKGSPMNMRRGIWVGKDKLAGDRR